MQITLVHKIDEADNIVSFYFSTDRPLRYTAGQFIEMTIPHDNPDNRGVKHWFTLSSAPGRELISITTKLADKPSTFKEHLWNLQAGDQVEISEPMGDFVLPMDESIPLVFIAGGIGITPYHSIVQWLEDKHQTRQIQMIYALHSEKELVFQELFTKPYIELITLVNKPQLTVEKITELIDGFDNKQIFISGPEPMTEGLVEQFKAIDINQDQLITDYFPGYPA